MNHLLKQALSEKGFFDTNGIYSKFVGTRLYEVNEEKGRTWIETSFDGPEPAKNELLDHIESLASRYALTQAKIRGRRVYVDLTAPTADPRLEATRLDFLTQSLESGIQRIEAAVQPQNPWLAAETGHPAARAGNDPSASAVPDSKRTRPAEPTFPPEAVMTSMEEMIGADDIEPVAEGLADSEYRSKTNDRRVEADLTEAVDLMESDDLTDAADLTDPDDLTDEEEEHYYDIPAAKPVSQPVRPSSQKTRESRSRAAYVRPEENPNHGDFPKGVVTGLIDRSFSAAGFIGAILGAILGAVLMAGVHVMGVPAQPVGFAIPFLVIGIYRVMAGNQMPIGLGILLVLASLLLGSVLISAAEVLQQVNVGLLEALGQGLAAHYDNSRFYVANVWLKIGLSLIAASIPSMLLLAGGKRKVQYSK